MPDEWGVRLMIRNFIQKVRGGASRTKLQVLLALFAGTSLLTPSVAHAAGPLDAAVSWVVNGAAGVVGGFIGTIAIPIALLFLTISNFVLWVSGLVFNWAVIRTVFQFGTYFGTSDEMLIAWGVMRDVANIGLLFGFIFMGVLLILNVEGGGHGHGGGISAKKAIPRLLIFAVLVNFSLFTTQAVIDVSNGLASVFAEQAGQKCDLGDTEKCANLGIASVISQRAGITTIYSGGPPLDNPLKAAVVYVGLSIFVMITAMVLLAGAIMFVYRAVVLSFLMVTSPIGFAGMAIPSLKKIADEWWSKLISQSFFAPVYLLLIFISLKLTETLANVSQSNGGKGSLASALAGTGGEPGTEAGNIQIVLVFMVVIGFMMASLVTANKMGAVGAKFATKTAGALTIGTAGFVGRRTLGRASTMAASRLRSSGLAETGIGKRLVGVADYGSKASFSARNLAGKALEGTGVDVGKANKDAAHGFHGIEEKLKKEQVEYAKSLKGPGTETSQARDRRVAEETRANAEEKTAASAALVTTTADLAAATAAATAAAAALSAQQETVASLRAAATQNPQNASLQAELMRQQQILATSEVQASKSTERLSLANAALATATERKAKADAATVNTDRAEVSEKQRQINYAKAIEHRGTSFEVNGRTYRGLSAHANHDAASDIIKHAGKSDLERAFDRLNEEAKKKAEGAGGGGGGGGGHAPKASGGGGGGDHH